jgi:hypothetical protein
MNISMYIRQLLQPTLLGNGEVYAHSSGVKTKFAISMDECHNDNIKPIDFDPDEVFPDIINLGNQLSEVLTRLPNDQRGLYNGT